MALKGVLVQARNGRSGKRPCLWGGGAGERGQGCGERQRCSGEDGPGSWRLCTSACCLACSSCVGDTSNCATGSFAHAAAPPLPPAPHTPPLVPSQVRGLCRQQFFARALGLKAATAQQLSAARAQQQQQLSAAPQQQQHPGARAGGPGAGGGQQQRIETLAYPLAHGDAWSHGVQPPAVAAAGGLPYGPAAVHTGMLTNPLAGAGR